MHLQRFGRRKGRHVRREATSVAQRTWGTSEAPSFAIHGTLMLCKYLGCMICAFSLPSQRHSGHTHWWHLIPLPLHFWHGTLPIVMYPWIFIYIYHMWKLLNHEMMLVAQTFRYLELVIKTIHLEFIGEVHITQLPDISRSPSKNFLSVFHQTLPQNGFTSQLRRFTP